MGANNGEQIEEELGEEELAAKLETARQERVQKATEEIQAILDKYNVSLQAFAVMRADRIKIVPRE